MSIEEPQLVRADPELDTSVAAMTEAGGNLLSGDLLAAASAVVKGLDLAATVDVVNDSSVPIYVPSTDHTVFFNGVDITGEVTAQGGMLSGGETMVLELAAFVPADELPDALLIGMLNGGNFELTVVSSLGVGPITVIEREFSFSLSATDALKQAILGGG